MRASRSPLRTPRRCRCSNPGDEARCRPDVEIPNLSVPESVLAAGRERPDAPALIDGLKGDVITHGQLAQYVDHIIEELPLPLMLYNIPSLTKVTFEIETIRELSKHKQIVGVKDIDARCTGCVR